MIPILFLIDEIETWGGTEKHLFELTCALDATRYRPLIVVLHGAAEIDRFRASGLECIVISHSRTLGPEGVVTALRLARVMRARATRLVVTYHTSADLLGPLAASLAGAACISSRRDLGFTKRPLHVRLQREMNRWVSGMAVVSKAVRNRVLETEAFASDRIHVIANGVDASIYGPHAPHIRATSRAEFGFADDEVVIGTLANFDPIKGYDFFFRTASHLLATSKARVRFLLLGSGSLLETFRARAREHGTTFVLPGSRSDVPRMLAAMDIFALASKSEGFSNAILQAMASSLPIVATDVGGNRETVDSQCATLVDYDDAEGFANALDRLAQNRDLRHSQGLSGRARVQRLFTQRAMISAYQHLFDQTVGEIGAMDETRSVPWKRAFKSLLAEGYTRAPSLRARPPICLCYHRVLKTVSASDPWLVVGEKTFARQLETLARHYEFVTAHEYARRQASPKKQAAYCAITFDDGYADNLEVAAPILAAFRIPATLYVTTNAVTTGQALWFERVAAIIMAAFEANPELVRNTAASLLGTPQRGRSAVSLQRGIVAAMKALNPKVRDETISRLEGEFGTRGDPPRYLDREGVLALHRLGWEIGSHTRTHPILPEAPDEDAVREIQDSKRDLETMLSAKIHGFAYPNGDANERVAAMVRAAGYDYAVVAMPGQAGANDRFRIARRCVSDHSSRGYATAFSASAFLAEVEGVLDRMRG